MKMRDRLHPLALLALCLSAWLGVASVTQVVVVDLGFDSDLESTTDGVEWVYYSPGGQSELAGTYYNTGFRYYVDPVWESGAACNPFPGTVSVIRLSLDLVSVTSVVVDWSAGPVGNVDIIATDIDNVILDHDRGTNFGGSGYSLTGATSLSDVAYVYVLVNTKGTVDTDLNVSCITNITINSPSAGPVLIDRSGLVGVGDPARIYADRYEFDDAVISDSYLSWSLTNPTQSCWTYGSDGYFQGSLTAASIYGADGMPLPSAVGTDYGYIYARVVYPEPVRVWFSFDQFTIDGGWNKVSWVVSDTTCGLSGVSNGAKNHQAVGEYANVTELGVINGIPAFHPGPAALDNLNVRGHAEGSTYDWIYSSLPPPSGGPGLPEFVQPIASADLLDHTEFTDSETGEYLSPSIIVTTRFARVYAVHGGTVTNVSNVSGGYGTRIDLTSEGGYVSVYSGLSQIFVTPGDTVAAGCLLGYAGMPLNTDDPDLLALDPGEFVYGLIDSSLDYIDWTVFSQPEGNVVCGSGWKTEHCLTNNPQLLDNAALWSPVLNSRLEGPTVLSDQVQLDPMTGIRQTIAPLEAGTYTISLAVTLVSTTSATLDISLGDSSNEVEISEPPGRVSMYEVTLTPSTPDYSPDGYDLTLYNGQSSNGAVRISFACLHEDDALIPPPPCYFDDPYFESQNAWTLGDDAEIINPSGLLGFSLSALSAKDNELVFVDGPDAWAYDGVSLGGNQASAEYYYLSIDARIADDTETAWLTIFHDAPVDIDLWIDDSILGPVSLGSFEVARYLFFYHYELEFWIAADTYYDGDFYIEADDGTWPATGVSSTEIYKVCLEPVDGTWPLPAGASETDWDYVYPHGGGSIVPGGDLFVSDTPIPGSCPVPNNLNIAAWLAWMQCKTDKTLGDVIFPALGGLISILSDLLSLFWGLGRWLWLTLSKLLAFLLSLTAYLVGTLVNLLASLLSDIFSAIFGLDLFRQAFDLLDLATLGLGLLWDVLTLIWHLITSLFKAILAVAQFVARFFISLVAAINSGDAGSTFDLSTCETPGDLWYNLCVLFSMIQYVMDDMPVVLALGYIASGVLGLRFIMITIREFGTASGQVG